MEVDPVRHVRGALKTGVGRGSGAGGVSQRNALGRPLRHQLRRDDLATPASPWQNPRDSPNA